MQDVSSIDKAKYKKNKCHLGNETLNILGLVEAPFFSGENI